jgi:hypothetical protein
VDIEVHLGPWTAAKTVPATHRITLPKIMGDEAVRTVQNTAGVTGKEVKGKPAAKGITISGKVTGITTKSGATQVTAQFNVWVDGTFGNVGVVEGKATASGGSTAEDALRAVTESRIRGLLEVIKAGRVLKAS